MSASSLDAHQLHARQRRPSFWTGFAVMAPTGRLRAHSLARDRLPSENGIVRGRHRLTWLPPSPPMRRSICAALHRLRRLIGHRHDFSATSLISWPLSLARGHGQVTLRQLVPIRFECFPKRCELSTARCALVTLPAGLAGLRSKCRCCIRRSRNNQGRCAQDYGGRPANKNERLISSHFHSRFSVVVR